MMLVSIHAPAWGATLVLRLAIHKGQGFQSTHPRGVRQTRATESALSELVSIHAPAWGATGPSLQQSAVLQSFNPRTRVGCDEEA